MHDRSHCARVLGEHKLWMIPHNGDWATRAFVFPHPSHSSLHNFNLSHEQRKVDMSKDVRARQTVYLSLDKSPSPIEKKQMFFWELSQSKSNHYLYYSEGWGFLTLYDRCGCSNLSLARMWVFNCLFSSTGWGLFFFGHSYFSLQEVLEKKGTARYTLTLLALVTSV